MSALFFEINLSEPLPGPCRIAPTIQDSMDGYSVFLECVENRKRETTRKQAVVRLKGSFVNSSVKPKRFDVSLEVG
jgi:hypothetical protein